MDAIVTDVHFASAIGGLRALGRAGYRVLALGPRAPAAGRWSRYATRRASGPPVQAYRDALASRVAELTRSHGPLVVYPGGEKAIDALLSSPELPPEATLPFPSADGLGALRDKRRLPDLTAGSGLEAPRTLAEATAGELATTAPPGPCVVKDALPGGTLGSARLTRSGGELRELVRALPEGTPLLVQEALTGRLTVAAVVLDRDGAVVAWFQQAVERVWPTEAGAAALAVSVPPNERLLERIGRMLAATGYWGLAQVDLLETGRGPVLIDVNTRFYTSLPLALACGANLPAAWHAIAVGEPPPNRRPYRAGVRFRSLDADLSAALRGSPRTLLSIERRPRVGAVWAADDPVPALLLAAGAVADRAGRRLSALRSRHGRGPGTARGPGGR